MHSWLPEPAAAPPVVVLGDLMTDVVARLSGPVAYGSDTPVRISVHAGGSAANVAAWLALAGVPVAFVACVGEDAYGGAAVADLSGYGVSCHVVADPELPTGTCVVLVTVDGERSMLPDAGANAALSPPDVPRSLFRPGRHLHLSGYALLRGGSRDAALAALDYAQAHRMTVSVDPSSAGPLAAVGPERFLDWTRGVDVVLANRDEAQVLTGQAQPRAAAAALADTYREAVVTCGAAGAVWHGGFLAASAAAERVDVADTTGAGDAFAAGFSSSGCATPSRRPPWPPATAWRPASSGRSGPARRPESPAHCRDSHDSHVTGPGRPPPPPPPCRDQAVLPRLP